MGFRLAPAKDMEEKQRTFDTDWGRALALGAVAGVRSMTGLHAVTGRRRATWVLMWGERLGDALDILPPRTVPVSLAGRGLIGAHAAACTTKRPAMRLALAALGAASAVAAAALFSRARNRI